MDSKKVFTAGTLTDDIVVEILSWVPYKSFCRFKCVSKAWLAFSSDPHYHQKLLKIPTGLFHKGKDGSAVQLLSLSPNDEGIDGALTFLLHHKHLEFVDCCNGLVLCNTRAAILLQIFVASSCATRQHESGGRFLIPILAHMVQVAPCIQLFWPLIHPSWSSQFYVFNFEKRHHDNYLQLDVRKLEVFSSELSTWLVDAAWSSPIQVHKSRGFIGGVLYVQTYGRENLVFKGLEAMISGIPPHHFTIKMQHDPWRLANGCFGQSSGFLQCAFPEESGDTVAVFNLDSCRPYKWSLKHRLSARDVF
jgi:hypothetical protein